MNLKECYDSFGGSYEVVKEHLQRDELIQRLVIKFISDKSYERLNAALQEKDYKEAFVAAHTLKGVCLNLSFARLSSSSSALTELLRHYEKEPIDEAACQSLWQQVSKDYAEVVDALGKLS